MTTFQPRSAYSQDELDHLYPSQLKLRLVQVLLRHGERSPVSARFQNAGLSPYWPYCDAAKRVSSVAMTSTDCSQWSSLQWRRRLETFGPDDVPILAAGPRGETDGVCNLGELTDTGRATTLALGQRLRKLYVEQLRFMPRIIADADMIYLRATPIPRALESVQQSFWGMYPLTARTASFPPPTIISRNSQEETLYPNQNGCPRFDQLMKAFGKRTAENWNKTTDMAYLSSKISKYMPDQAKVAVDSHPRLSGIMDTINSTLAHGPETRLPATFYDQKARAIIDKIGVEEWFSGYKESNEYRTTGIGALAGDIVARMVGSANRTSDDGIFEVGGDTGQIDTGRGGETNLMFGLSGCHDTTLAALLTSLGCFEGEPWPPYTSHIALELFQRSPTSSPPPRTIDRSNDPSQHRNPFKRLFGNTSVLTPNVQPFSTAHSTTRKPLSSMSTSEKAPLTDHFVRIRYNDRPMIIPGCKLPGNHLDGDESFCTLEAFKAIVDKFTPLNWKDACSSNLGQSAFPAEVERPGFA